MKYLFVFDSLVFALRTIRAQLIFTAFVVLLVFASFIFSQKLYAATDQTADNLTAITDGLTPSFEGNFDSRDSTQIDRGSEPPHVVDQNTTTPGSAPGGIIQPIPYRSNILHPPEGFVGFDSGEHNTGTLNGNPDPIPNRGNYVRLPDVPGWVGDTSSVPFNSVNPIPNRGNYVRLPDVTPAGWVGDTSSVPFNSVNPIPNRGNYVRLPP